MGVREWKRKNVVRVVVVVPAYKHASSRVTAKGPQAYQGNRRCGWLSQQAGIRVKGAKRSDWCSLRGRSNRNGTSLRLVAGVVAWVASRFPSAFPSKAIGFAAPRMHALYCFLTS